MFLLYSFMKALVIVIDYKRNIFRTYYKVLKIREEINLNELK